MERCLWTYICYISSAIQARLYCPAAAFPLWKHTNELQVLILLSILKQICLSCCFVYSIMLYHLRTEGTGR